MQRTPHPRPLSLTVGEGGHSAIAYDYGSVHTEDAPLSRARESRLGCRSGAERDQSAWGGGEG